MQIHFFKILGIACMHALPVHAYRGSLKEPGVILFWIRKQFTAQPVSCLEIFLQSSSKGVHKGGAPPRETYDGVVACHKFCHYLQQLAEV